MVTVAAVVTALVVIANVAVVAFAGTVTDPGTVAALVLLLASVTAAPPTGAAAASFTVPVLPVPPVTATGFSERENVDGFTTTVSAFVAPLYFAVMVTFVAAVTGFVLTVNIAVVAFGATVTEAGTVAALVLLLSSVTTAPAAGAALLSVTVPLLVAPAVTCTGFIDKEVSGGLTTIVTTLVAPL